MVDRRAVLDNARYLRNVRPIDPEEIQEYVEGRPHPAVVRQIVREAAFDLGVIEREDGSFVPIPDDPVEPHLETVRAFPERYARRLEDRLVERYGPDWHRGETGDRLRETIRRTKERYFQQDDVEYDAEAADGYAIYHLPDFYAAVQYVLEDLARDDLLHRRLRVLDVGAGVGGPALGLIDYLPEDALVEYHAVEPAASADVLSAMLEETGRNVRTTVHRTRIEDFEAEGEYDLLLFANVLNELADPIAVVERLLDHLASEGTGVLLAPADENTSRNLREVERAVEGTATDAGTVGVYGPEPRLWPGETPSDGGWSFDVRPDLEVPPFQRRLDDAGGATGEFVNVDVQFSPAILRVDGRERYAFSPDPGRWAKLADTEDHVTKRIDCLGVKLSHDLSDDGNPLFRVGDGSQSVDHYAVLVKETALNRDLAVADYGDLLTIEGALALWNDDERAYNLVVDEETVVDRIPP
ncbi:MAG TPA: class I SAM-dependent methyltransferase [Natrialbaceae archaeon]|nr:class I SAM-dependent methyltransferase [Natrialbaceae archaeon]